MRADPEYGSDEIPSFREREWSERPKEREEREAQVLKRVANVRWLGEVGWRSMEMKWWRAARVLDWDEIRAVHETTLGIEIWEKRRRGKEEGLDLEQRVMRWLWRERSALWVLMARA